MDLDLKALAHNKKAWLGVGAAAALGGFVFLRRRKTAASGAPGTSTGAMSGATGSGAGAVADTTGTDLASFLGNYQQSLTDQLSAGLDAIKSAAGGGNTTGSTPGNIGGYVRNSDGTYNVPVAGGTNWADLQNALGGVGLNGDIQTLLNLNPGLMTDVNNVKGANNQWFNFFKNPITVKVPTLPTAATS